MWSGDAAVGFHLTIVGCGSAAGFVVPPLFILPGVTVKLDVLDECDVHGAAATTTSSGFMNSGLFSSWIRFFACSVPMPIKRPLVLVLDGCSSHYSLQVLEEAEKYGILLVFLPANATHLLQPLDVAVFRSSRFYTRLWSCTSPAMDRARSRSRVPLIWRVRHGKDAILPTTLQVDSIVADCSL